MASTPARATSVVAAVFCLLLARSASPPAWAQNGSIPVSQGIVFVCEHGSVKSLIAALHFNRLAKERGLTIRAVSRGVAPDPEVPPKIAAALGAEGFDVATYKPAALKPEEAAAALKVISIGADLAGILEGRPVAAERWDDIPPASLDYTKAREALLERLEALLLELAPPGR